MRKLFRYYFLQRVVFFSFNAAAPLQSNLVEGSERQGGQALKQVEGEVEERRRSVVAHSHRQTGGLKSPFAPQK